MNGGKIMLLYLLIMQKEKYEIPPFHVAHYNLSYTYIPWEFLSSAAPC